MLLRTSSLYFIAVFVTFFGSSAKAQDVELSDLSPELQASIEKVEILRLFRGLTKAQEVQEKLFIAIPMPDLNKTTTADISENSTSVSSPPQKKTKKHSKAKGIKNMRTNSLVPRAGDCTGAVWQEGDDPCAGRENEVGFVPCQQPCTFTRDHFVTNRIFTPLINGCLFYTSGQSAAAKQYAVEWSRTRASQPLVTIWQLWPKGYYDFTKSITNPMRCIIQADVFQGRRNNIRQGYFERMSDAVAYMCGGTTVVMDPNMNKGASGRIKRAGIWGTIEFPRLRKTGDGNSKWRDVNGVLRVCDRIDAIGSDQIARPSVRWWKNWWLRGGPVWPVEYPVPPIKRGVVGDSGEGNGNSNVTSDHEQNLRERSLERRAPPENNEVQAGVFDDPNGKFYVEW